MIKIVLSFLIFISLENLTLAQSSYKLDAPGTAVDPSKMNLTDQDRYIMKNFRSNSNDQQKCLKEAKGDASLTSICNSGQDTKDMKILGIDEGMMKMLPMIYSMIVGQIGDGAFEVDVEKAKDAAGGVADSTQEKVPTQKPSNNTPKANQTADTPKTEKKKTNDYCRYIPMAGEMLSMANYSTASAPIQANQKKSTSKQADSLYNAAREHQNRASAAQVQTTTWGAGLTCYVAYGLTGAASMSDPNYLIKLGGSALFTAYFAGLVSKHKEYANQLKTMAKKMPGLGDCNPITDNACYCSLPPSEIDIAKYCLPKANANIRVLNGYLATCIDANLKDDPSCNCDRTNTCYDKIFASQFDNLPYASSFGTSPTGLEFKNLTKGKVSPANLRASNNGLNALKKLNFNKIPSPSKALSKSQNKAALAMTKIGIPPKLAALLATTPIKKSASKYASKFKGFSSFRSPRRYRRRSRSNSKVYRYGKAQRKSSNSRRNNSFNMNKYLKKKKKRNNSKVYRFARKAEARAQINQDTSKPIFEIISRRYKITAWKSLEWE